MYALFSVIRVGGTFTLGRYFHASKAKETLINGEKYALYTPSFA